MVEVERARWRWWTVVLRGIAAIAFGIVSLLDPGQSFKTLTLLFGGFAIVDGALWLCVGERSSHPAGMVAHAVVSFWAGSFALLAPGLTPFALLLVIAGWAIIAGGLEVAMALWVPGRDWLLGVAGAVSVAFGVILFVSPLAGAIVLGLWVGAYAVVFGAMLVEAGLRLRSRADGSVTGARAVRPVRASAHVAR
jgi:uncharacterized membrane protein HdeD (DUF308 family)